MHIQAQLQHRDGSQQLKVGSAGRWQSLSIAAKPGGGSAVNGGELLLLALATCYCNDLYREAAALQLVLQAVEVEASADFEGVGLPASGVRYRARVEAEASAEQIEALLERTDRVAEVHNSLRAGVPVVREAWVA